MSELDAGELRARAQTALRRHRPDAELAELEPLHGGISSLTFAAGLSGAGEDAPERVAVKVAPPGLAPVRNRDVLRQARVLAGVHGAPGVRVPAVLATDDGTPPLFVMEFMAGEAYEPRWDLSERPPAPDTVRARGLAAARMLAALQAIEPAAAGLGDEPVLSLGDELERWAALFATVDDDLRAHEAQLRDALAARVPAPAPARILHGDYRLGNMQFAGERLAALIDWEIWSVGDPRADLAWLLMYADPIQQRHHEHERDAANAAAAAAMPSGAELLAEFLDAAGATAPPPELAWFQALCCYKLAAAVMAIAKRNRRLAEPDPTLELAAATTPPMLDHALALLRG